MAYKLSFEEQNRLKHLLEAFPVLVPVHDAICAIGGALFVVGGAVRNILLDQPIADLDVEVYHVSIEQLQRVLERFGRVDFVGKSFGVLRLAGVDIDWALPRKDQAGRHPDVTLIPDLSLEEALRRRDITMNAMALDIQTHELHDPFHGRADMQAKIMRTPDPVFFVQDPLRFYRVMQFIGRFQMLPDKELNAVCCAIDLTTLSLERIGAEFDKLLLQSTAPSWGLRWLADLGRLRECLPELAATIGILQDQQWHPEGDVFEHTMQVIDVAAQQEYPPQVDRRTIIYAALCHDLGKAVSTAIRDGKIRSIGHDHAGAPLARSLLRRILRENKLTHVVETLVCHHMAPGRFVQQQASAAAYKRLAHAIAPQASLRMLACLAYADKSGRNPQQGIARTIPVPDVDLFIERAQEYGVLDEPEAPVLCGKDLLPHVAAGPEMGKLLHQAYEIQINKDIHDKDELLRRVLPDVFSRE